MTDNIIGTPDDPKHLVSNDAVAGETVLPSDSYAGPNGAEPVEAEPVQPENSLGAENVDLDDEPPASEAGSPDAGRAS
jgi:hypothetical protein